MDIKTFLPTYIVAMASTLVAMASTLVAMFSNLLAMACNLIANNINDVFQNSRYTCRKKVLHKDQVRLHVGQFKALLSPRPPEFSSKKASPGLVDHILLFYVICIFL